MTARTTFTGFEPFELTGVVVTDRELGHGSYATVLELDYMGLKCAGKKLHEVLIRQGDTSYTVRRFKEECHLLSQVRHPNIVQFLGVHFFHRDQIPILVMEFLPTNLTSCIEQYGILPKEISYSILHDVALGLNYLHGQTPPIIHRDLSSNNVLLTPNMTAKISDLGVARILNLSPGHFTQMTQTPGTPAYMPPEVMVANPKYDTSVDAFSYGILMIHVLSGRWPEPQVGQVKLEEGKLIPVSEAERREIFLQAIGNDHPLMALIRKCINNDPSHRVSANMIVESAAALAVQSSAMSENKLEILRCTQIQDKKIRSLSEEVNQKAREIEHLNLIHATEVEALHLQVKTFDSEGTLLKEEKNANVEELKANVILYESQIEHVESTLKQLKTQQAKERGEFEVQLSNERLASQKLMAENFDLRSEVTKLKVVVNSMQCKISSLEADIALKDVALSQKDASLKRCDAKIEAKSKAIQSKDAIISQMDVQLTRVREYLATNQQALHVEAATISWTQCADLPTKMSAVKSTIIEGKVFCRGVTETGGDTEYIVYCYTISQDKWTTLPPLPVKWFGLGHINGKLVAIGGWKRNGDQTNMVYTYDEQLRKWKQTIPPMPTSRVYPSVLSLQSQLFVIGGYSPTYSTAVEIFRSDLSQWFKADPLPKACCDMSSVTIDNTIYTLGGYKHPLHLNQAMCASISDLLHSAVPEDNSVQSEISFTKSVWKKLPDTPMYEPAAAILAGKLLAIGGTDTAKKGANRREIYTFSESANSWMYIGDLPAPRFDAAVAIVSSMEILVIGGWGGGDTAQERVNTVYKGALKLADQWT